MHSLTLLSLSIYLTTFDYTYGETQGCGGDCDCNGGQDCKLNCPVENSCSGHTLTCAVGYNCIVDCLVGSACKSFTTISAQGAHNLIVNCQGSEACKELTVNCPTNGCNCTINCLSGSDVTCKTLDINGGLSNYTGADMCTYVDIQCGLHCNIDCATQCSSMYINTDNTETLFLDCTGTSSCSSQIITQSPTPQPITLPPTQPTFTPTTSQPSSSPSNPPTTSHPTAPSDQPTGVPVTISPTSVPSKNHTSVPSDQPTVGPITIPPTSTQPTPTPSDKLTNDGAVDDTTEDPSEITQSGEESNTGNSTGINWIYIAFGCIVIFCCCLLVFIIGRHRKKGKAQIEEEIENTVSGEKNNKMKPKIAREGVDTVPKVEMNQFKNEGDNGNNNVYDNDDDDDDDVLVDIDGDIVNKMKTPSGHSGDNDDQIIDNINSNINDDHDQVVIDDGDNITSGGFFDYNNVNDDTDDTNDDNVMNDPDDNQLVTEGNDDDGLINNVDNMITVGSITAGNANINIAADEFVIDEDDENGPSQQSTLK